MRKDVASYMRYYNLGRLHTAISYQLTMKKVLYKSVQYDLISKKHCISLNKKGIIRPWHIITLFSCGYLNRHRDMNLKSLENSAIAVALSEQQLAGLSL